MKHSVRWFAACLAIGLLQFWMWTGMAKEDHEPIGFGDFLFSLTLVCVVAWWILPKQRPCGFNRGPLLRARLGFKDPDGGRLGSALAAIDDWMDRHLWRDYP
jgi:hypothetical protein